MLEVRGKCSMLHRSCMTQLFVYGMDLRGVDADPAALRLHLKCMTKYQAQSCRKPPCRRTAIIIGANTLALNVICHVIIRIISDKHGKRPCS